MEHPKRIVNSPSQRQTQDLKEESQTCQQKEERQRIGEKLLEKWSMNKWFDAKTDTKVPFARRFYHAEDLKEEFEYPNFD